MSLAHPECQTFLKSISKKESVYKSGINSGHADNASTAYCCDTLA